MEKRRRDRSLRLLKPQTCSAFAFRLCAGAESLHENPDEPPEVPVGGVTKRRVLRDAPLAELARAGREYVSEKLASEAEQLAARGIFASPALREQYDSWAVEFRSQPRPGRRGRPDIFYAELARDFCAHVGPGPGGTVADFAAARHLSRSQVNSLLGEATRPELFVSRGQGVKGGTTTNKADALLEKET